MFSKEIEEFIHAWAKGVPVQFRTISSEETEWEDVLRSHIWSYSDLEYRFKPRDAVIYSIQMKSGDVWESYGTSGSTDHFSIEKQHLTSQGYQWRVVKYIIDPNSTEVSYCVISTGGFTV